MSDLVSEVLETVAPQYGVLETGFSRMRLPEIRRTIIDDLQRRTGLVFETRPDSITGQFIDTFAEREAILWELAESVYHAMYPISSFGINLDHAVSFAGVRRLFERRTSVWAILYGNEGTVVPTNAVVRQIETQDNYLLLSPVTITRTAAVDVIISVNTAIYDQLYTIQINDIVYGYTAQAGDSALDIAAGLAIALLGSRLELHTDANTIRIWTVEFVSFSIVVSVGISIIQLGSGGSFLAQEYGDLVVPIDTLTKIVVSINGWNATNNIVEGLSGRELEVDDELRQRYNTGVFRLGAGTLPAIRANLLETVPGILALEIFANNEDTVDQYGRLPHSIEVVIYGGDPQLIANEIFRLKGAGIDTNGEINVNVVDTQGYFHPIRFNRPTSVAIWVKIEVWLYAGENFPVNAISTIQNTVAEFGNSISIGGDVIVQRFYGPIYRAVTGISRLIVLMAKDISVAEQRIPDDTDFSDTNIEIIPREVARFDISRVLVFVHYPEPGQIA